MIPASALGGGKGSIILSSNVTKGGGGALRFTSIYAIKSLGRGIVTRAIINAPRKGGYFLYPKKKKKQPRPGTWPQERKNCCGRTHKWGKNRHQRETFIQGGRGKERKKPGPRLLSYKMEKESKKGKKKREE